MTTTQNLPTDPITAYASRILDIAEASIDRFGSVQAAQAALMALMAARNDEVA